MHGIPPKARSSLRTLMRGLSILLCAVLLLVVNSSSSLVTATADQPDLSLPVAQNQPGNTCSVQIEAALEQVGTACAGVGRNQACYGNELIDTLLRPNIQPIRFESAGDIANITSFERITTSPYNEATGEWGIALFKAQVNLPRSSLPGQLVTFLMYGDASVETDSPTMRVFNLETRVGGITCNEVPESALLIQTPDNLRVRMEINGAELVLGSTAHITSVFNDEMIISLLEGEGVLTAFGEERVLVPGSEVWLPLGGDDGLTIIDVPSEVRPYHLDEQPYIPVELLGRVFEMPPPIVGDSSVENPNQISTPQACVENPLGWGFSYVVQPGDTLSGIAARAGVTLQELMSANCIDDAGRLLAGTIVGVPIPIAAPATSTPIPVPTATNVPSGGEIRITANPTRIARGDCTTLTWEINSFVSYTAFINGRDVTGINAMIDCPRGSTTYVLQVNFQTGETSTASVYVEVTGFASTTCGNDICQPDYGENANTCPADCPNDIN